MSEEKQKYWFKVLNFTSEEIYDTEEEAIEAAEEYVKSRIK